MPKSGPRARRLRRRTTAPARRDVHETRPLVERILDSPRLTQAVPRLPPELLHRVIQTCGLEDCAPIVALATPGQLMRVFDLDLWRCRRPGLDEELDADRFGIWLEVLMEAGAAAAADKVAGLDADLVGAALSAHIFVFDRAAVSPFTTLDGEESVPLRRTGDGPACEVARYMIEARRSEAWDAIASLLFALDAAHPLFFHRVMRGCRERSCSRPEIDGLDDLLAAGDQQLFDLAVDREGRREQQGYAQPAQARAFLQMARELPLDGAEPRRNPVADAYFRSLESREPGEAAADEASTVITAGGATDHDVDAAAALVSLLVETGVAEAPPPRALLPGSPDHTPRFARLHGYMQAALDRDPAEFSRRTGELAFLANTLIAGCAVQGRAFTTQQASDAAAAACNLGLENWPHRRLLSPPSLVAVFEIGWSVLHRQVAMAAAERLIDALAGLRCHDRETQVGVSALRLALANGCREHTPWRARASLDVIMILDMPAWAALLGLIDECPVIHAAIAASRGSRTQAIGASEFDFISENRQIESIHAFLASLPDTLRS